MNNGFVCVVFFPAVGVVINRLLGFVISARLLGGDNTPIKVKTYIFLKFNGLDIYLKTL